MRYAYRCEHRVGLPIAGPAFPDSRGAMYVVDTCGPCGHPVASTHKTCHIGAVNSIIRSVRVTFPQVIGLKLMGDSRLDGTFIDGITTAFK